MRASREQAQGSAGEGWEIGRSQDGTRFRKGIEGVQELSGDVGNRDAWQFTNSLRVRALGHKAVRWTPEFEPVAESSQFRVGAGWKKQPSTSDELLARPNSNTQEETMPQASHITIRSITPDDPAFV